MDGELPLGFGRSLMRLRPGIYLNLGRGDLSTKGSQRRGWRYFHVGRWLDYLANKRGPQLLRRSECPDATDRSARGQNQPPNRPGSIRSRQPPQRLDASPRCSGADIPVRAGLYNISREFSRNTDTLSKKKDS